jgi:hypothetical protein
MQLSFLIACGERFRGRQGIGRRPEGQSVIDRMHFLMDQRIAEYAVMDARKAADNG